MQHKAVLIVALGMALMGTLINLPDQSVEAAPARPDIVMFYIDDFAPYPSWLWRDAERTPNVARFANHGLEFRNARAATPMCGPARANLLTGRYGHNSGVTKNDIKVYEQRGTLSPKLRQQGYKTVFIGKYINLLASRYPTRSAMRGLSNDWSQFDVVWEDQGRFYDWRQYRKSGTHVYGSAPDQHSAYQASKRAVQHIKMSDRDRPLFMVVSLYEGHAPLTPLNRFEGHPACAGIKGWAGPAYDEADVSDKPAWVQAHPRLIEPSYELRERCESLMTIDWVIGNVRQALKDSGRIGNTLQVLTADNGWLMGDHRLEAKMSSYSTPVPMYVRWPKVLQGRKRIVTEPVANVDLAPTFCAIAGCKIRDADGRSLLPLIKGTRKMLDREFIFTEMLHSDHFYKSRATGRPSWAGVESTLKYDDKLWAYARYRTGEEELYNVSVDPHRLHNLVGRSAHKKTLNEMRGFYDKVWVEDKVSFRFKLKPQNP